MTREEAIKIISQMIKDEEGFLSDNTVEAHKMAIKALEQEPCGDAISRQAVLEMAYDMSEIDGEHFTEPCMVVEVEDIQKLPPVNPQEPKTGHWEWVQYDYNPKFGNWHCSECRCVVVECVGKEEKGGIPLYKYCPQCGAKMIEPQESEE